jgi:hypothetical protein
MNRRIVVRTRTGWRDIPVEQRPILTPRRRRRIDESVPVERLVEHDGTPISVAPSPPRHFRLARAADGTAVRLDQQEREGAITSLRQ